MPGFYWTAAPQLHRLRRKVHMDSACGICTAVNGEPGGGPTILRSSERLRSAVIVIRGQQAAPQPHSLQCLANQLPKAPLQPTSTSC
jgi:hypothetical protein